MARSPEAKLRFMGRRSFWAEVAGTEDRSSSAILAWEGGARQRRRWENERKEEGGGA